MQSSATIMIFILKILLSLNLFTYFKLNIQDTHNQAGIAHNGGLSPLLKLLDSKNGSLQHNAAFTLYGLADNEVYIIYDLQELVEFYIFDQPVDIEYHFNVMLFCSFIFSSRIMCPILLGLEVFRSCRMENLFFKYISCSLP